MGHVTLLRNLESYHRGVVGTVGSDQVGQVEQVGKV
jgi:hypothetical protein